MTPGVPVTTNFMVMGGTKGMNYADWAGEIDFVSNDHYVMPGPQDRDELSFSANLVSGISGGHPWFLMEHSTSAVNWQPVNVAKRPGDLARDSLVHVAHGADAVCFFQWRQSAAGAEKYHSAMVPHAGSDSDVFRAVTGLGQTLRTLAPVAGTEREPARVGIVFDWESWWASEQDSHPTALLDYRREGLDWYSALLALGIRADVVTAQADLGRYELLIAPVLHMVPAALAKELTRYVEHGGHLVTTYFSGVVDENDHIWLGGYPGALRDLLGIRIEEFGPLLDGESVELDGAATGTLWTDRISVTDPEAEVLAHYRSGTYAGRPAITRRAVGGVRPRTSPPGSARTASPVCCRVCSPTRAYTASCPKSREGASSWPYEAAAAAYLFLVNRTDEPVPLPGLAGDVLVGRADADGALVLPPREVAVLRQPAL